MNGLIQELLALGVPLWLVYPLLLTVALVLVIRTAASGIAEVVRATHPGESADAVTMQANRIRHRQWKARRRDGNRRARRARRVRVRAGVRDRFTGRRTGRYADSLIVLPRLVLPPDTGAGGAAAVYRRGMGA
ncbi:MULTISPECIES: hypothetical protein [unclassified Streptomyces]|uniref:hypothetical protein n=1 Tax=unclassified Streptomyces TaxID=2593676 RepID=UPI00093E7459|nr:hypothetical protein [Streptomyces sp. TSRI0281]OKI41641.1 hypothetical protein A6A29_37550 [Streptomyces sp. TSRI0281]